MFCNNCGSQNDDKANFCLNCGSRLIAPTVVVNPQQTMAAATQQAPSPNAPPPPMPPAVLAPPQPAPVDYTGQPQTSGKAIAALILGIVNALFFFFMFPIGVAAIILGHISRSDIKKSAGRLKGSGMALAGLILGYGSLAIVPIMIIAAIAIPNLLSARTAANESSAVGSIRTINTAAMSYYANYSKYPESLTVMGGVEGAAPTDQAAGLIDNALAGGSKSGYYFVYTPKLNEDGSVMGYTVTADPMTPGTTGRRHFFTDESGVIRVEEGRSADAQSPPLS